MWLWSTNVTNSNRNVIEGVEGKGNYPKVDTQIEQKWVSTTEEGYL